MPTLLLQTGLADVFEDAITPTLMFLPSLTPVDESVQLLEPAYQALFTLGDILYRDTQLKSRATRDGAEKDKNEIEKKEKEFKFWDRVIRKGILTGYAHANEYPAIVEVLVRNLGVVIEKMGIKAVKHLKVCFLCSFLSFQLIFHFIADKTGYHTHPLNNFNRPVRVVTPHPPRSRRPGFANYNPELLATDL